MIELPPTVARRIEHGGAGIRILVLRFGALGDILRTLPAVRLVRRGLPGAAIHWLAGEPWADFLVGHPDLDGVISFPRAIRARGGLSSAAIPRRIAQAFWRIRAVRAELVLDFHGDLKSGLAGLASGAPVRVGFSGPQQREGNRLFTTHRVPALARRAGRIERNLHLVRALGVEASAPLDAGLPLSESDAGAAREVVRSLAGDGRRYAVLSAGASRRQNYKKPPPILLAAAAQALARRDIAPVVVHGPGEREDGLAVVREAPGSARLAPLVDLRTLAALIRGAEVFVGGDSGPMHLACAVGCPVVALYGPTDPVVNAPWGVPSVALSPPGRSYTGIKRRDRRAGGFEGIEPSQVEAALERLLSSTDRRRAGPPPAG